MFAGGKIDDDEQATIFERAGRTPNDTTSATFNFAPGNLSGDSTWTWRLNLTDFAVPEEVYDKSGLRIVNSQWELQWPGGGSLNSFLDRAGLGNGTDQTICFTAVELLAPSNITTRYSQPGNCSEVLGSKCTEKLLAEATSYGCALTPIFSGSAIDECMDTLIDESESGIGEFTFSVGNASATTTRSGDTIYFDTYRAVPAANVSDTYKDAESRLNILLTRGETGTQAAMSCQIVNAEASSGSSGAKLGLNGYSSVLVALAAGLALALV